MRLRDDAVLPARAHSGDAGFDLSACEEVTIGVGERAAVGTGIAVEIPEGHAGLVVPRSGLALRHGVTCLNAPGTIDADYRGEIGVILVNHGREPFTVTRGMRVAQLVVARVARVAWRETAAIDDTKRAAGGFGSTGA